MPPKAPVHAWEWPERPWTRIHVDHAGPIQGKNILIVVNAHSKWIEAHVVQSISVNATIDKLQSTFATHGLPETIVSDNGPAFMASEFKWFTQRNGIQHLTSASYNPASNGLAERAVQTVKEGVKKMTGTLEVKIDDFFSSIESHPNPRQE